MAQSIKQRLVAAITDFYNESSDKKRNAIYDILRECLEQNAKFLLVFNPQEENDKSVLYACTMHDENGREAIAAFTSQRYAAGIQYTKIHSVELETIFHAVLENEEIDGLVLNPNSKSFLIVREKIQELLVPAEAYLQKGVEAYNAHDFAHAFDFYRRAAALGNVTALSNLGYCYYYGRSVPIDYQKAAECFEQAAKQGDVCATYKLGDMYGNGMLGTDEKKALDYYKKAFALATSTEERDPYSYPDVCLRLARYYANQSDNAEKAFSLILEAVIGFHIRIHEGDTFTDKVLLEALKLEQRLLKQRMKKKNV